jgi:hypothetical protein
MSGDSFQILDIQTAGSSLEHLHAHVVRCSGRIEIHCPSGKVCVLISKAELESLEQAIEILSNGSDYKQMCAEISEVANATTQPVVLRPAPSTTL